MIIAGKYEILEPIASSGGRSHIGRHRFLNQRVLVHFLGAQGSPESAQALASLESLTDESKRLFMDAGEENGLLFLVSWELPEFKDLPSWFARMGGQREFATQARMAPPAPPPAPPPVAAQPPPLPSMPPAAAGPELPQARRAPGPGEFTKFFIDRPAPPGVPAPPAFSTPPPAPKPTSATTPPGDFTKLFGGVPQPPAPPPAAPVVSPKPESGEFTRLFAGVAPQPPAPVQTPAPVAAGGPALPERKPSDWAGETAAFFRPEAVKTQPPTAPTAVPPPPPPAAVAPPAAPPLPPVAPPAAGPGEFTRFFTNPVAPQKAADPLTPHAPAGGISPLAPPPPLSQPSKPAAAQPPGELTQLLGGAPFTARREQAPPDLFAKQTAPPPVAPPMSNPLAPPPPLGRGGPVDAGATQVFSTKSHTPPPGSMTPPAPSGPGDFTRIISGGGGLTGGAPAPPSPPPAASKLSIPAMPPMPGAPPMPAKPPMPAMQAPPAPAPLTPLPQIPPAALPPVAVKKPGLPTAVIAVAACLFTVGLLLVLILVLSRR